MYATIKIAICVLFMFQSVHHTSQACTETGRFPNNSEPDCRGFTMCLRGAAGFMQYNLVCPEHTIYSHIDSQCTNVTEYKCHPTYNCTKEENIIDEKIKNCTSYISCVNDLNNILSARLIQCHANMAFNGSMCVDANMYQCSQKSDATNTIQVTIDNLSGNFTFNSAQDSSQNLCCSLFLSIFSLLCVTIL